MHTPALDILRAKTAGYGSAIAGSAALSGLLSAGLTGGLNYANMGGYDDFAHDIAPTMAAAGGLGAVGGGVAGAIGERQRQAQQLELQQSLQGIRPMPA